MTDADRWTEVVDALIAEAPEPPLFDDLEPSAPMVLGRRRRRGPLVAAAVATLVLILLATVVLVRVELDDSRSAPAAPPATSDAESEVRGVQPPTYLERLAQCDTAPIEEVNRMGTSDPTVSYFDHVTREGVSVDARAACRTIVELSPDPVGDMTASITMENGQIVAHYYELVRTVSGPDGTQPATNTQGAPVPPDVAAAKVAEYHAHDTDR